MKLPPLPLAVHRPGFPPRPLHRKGLRITACYLWALRGRWEAERRTKLPWLLALPSAQFCHAVSAACDLQIVPHGIITRAYHIAALSLFGPTIGLIQAALLVHSWFVL